MTRTLLLSVGYEPLRVISHRRAVVLLLDGKADLVESEPARQIRSQGLSMPVPSVVRLKYSVKIPYKSRMPLSRRAILARDRHKCVYCGHQATTIDHVIPRSRGGQHAWDNVVAACGPCNRTKGDRLLAELGWLLVQTPKAPHTNFWIVMDVHVQKEWAPYLGV